MEFDVSFTNKEITPWGGMVFLRQMLNKIGFKNQILSCEDLPQPQSNRGHKVSTILEAFITSIWYAHKGDTSLYSIRQNF